MLPTTLCEDQIKKYIENYGILLLLLVKITN